MLDTVERLESQLKKQNLETTHNLREPQDRRFENIAEEADAAMKRFTAKLRKELKMPSPSKAKGNRFEREVVNKAIQSGLTAKEHGVAMKLPWYA